MVEPTLKPAARPRRKQTYNPAHGDPMHGFRCPDTRWEALKAYAHTNGTSAAALLNGYIKELVGETDTEPTEDTQ